MPPLEPAEFKMVTGFGFMNNTGFVLMIDGWVQVIKGKFSNNFQFAKYITFY